jgi:hypothetical protein
MEDTIISTNTITKGHLSNLNIKNLSEKSLNEIIERYNRNATSLSLYQEDIDNSILSKLIDLFKDKPIQDITLEKCKIGDEQVKLLVEVKSLERLFLKNNKVGDEGVGYLAENNKIKWIDLSNNKIGNNGAISLSKSNKIIDVLRLDYNFIGNEGVDALSKSTTIRELYLYNNDNITGKKEVENLIANGSLVTVGVNINFSKNKGTNTTFINQMMKNYGRDGCKLYLILEDNLPQQLTLEYAPAIVKLKNGLYKLIVWDGEDVKLIEAPEKMENTSFLSSLFQQNLNEGSVFKKWNDLIITQITSEGHKNHRLKNPK